MRNGTQTSKNTLVHASRTPCCNPPPHVHPHHTPPRPQRAAACAREAIAGVLHTGVTGAPSAVRARGVSRVGRMAVGG
eukprot:scaffold30664_cov72-Phaeocystis_antarctica.AAC.1